MKVTTSTAGWLLCLGACSALAWSGCSKREESEQKIRHVEGLVKNVNLESSKVSMSWTDNKGKTQEHSAAVDESTEVLINGRAHELKDVREGDRATVYFYLAGSEADRRIIVTKAIIERPEESDWKPIKQPPATSTVEGQSAVTPAAEGSTRTAAGPNEETRGEVP